MKQGSAAIALLALLASLASAAEDYDAGKALFERKWDTEAGGGLGPYFNAKSCNGCHKDGGPSRIFRLDGAWIARGAVARIGAPGGQADARYGVQLQDQAIAALPPEAAVVFDFDGLPAAHVEFLQGAPDGASSLEIRVAPSLRGRSMLERVDAAAVLALEDPADADGDGISGRARKLFGGAIGRFGHRAATPTIARQAMEAAFNDLGLTTPGMAAPQGDCTALQTECIGRAGHAPPDIDAEALSALTAFSASLAAPLQAPDAAALAAFTDMGCAACHVPALPDREGRMLPVFTDLLLHDMGGGLAGVIGGGGFSPAEWRTAPLLDLAPLEGKRRYLHDGRARTIDEAIRHHGGEGADAAARYAAAPDAARRALAAFLEKQ